MTRADYVSREALRVSFSVSVLLIYRGNRMTEQQNLITPEQAAEYLGVSVRSLNKWRSTKTVNIPYKKISKCVRYSVPELDAYLSQNSFNSIAG